MALVDTVSIYGTIVDALGVAAIEVTCTFSVVCPPSCIENMGITLDAVSVDTDTSPA